VRRPKQETTPGAVARFHFSCPPHRDIHSGWDVRHCGPSDLPAGESCYTPTPRRVKAFPGFRCGGPNARRPTQYRGAAPGVVALFPFRPTRALGICPRGGSRPSPWEFRGSRVLQATPRAERPARIGGLYPPRMRGAVSRITSGGMEVRRRWANMRRPTGLIPPGAVALFSIRPSRSLGARSGFGSSRSPERGVAVAEFCKRLRGRSDQPA